MGIRFERDSRKATNGPMIFFSILKDETFEEEIRSAFISGLSFYAYRFPNDSMMSYGSSEGYLEGLGSPGFVAATFDPDYPIITIPYEGTGKKETLKPLYKMPAISTSFEEYSKEVEAILTQLDGNPDRKVVAARAIVKKNDFDIAEKFYELCQRFPDAFVFCFSTPATGCWMGASPELLLNSRNGVLNTMALAGTRKNSSDDGDTVSDSNSNEIPWDEKNIREQNIVTEFIGSVLRQNRLEPIIGETFTKSAGPIEHICTPVSAILRPDLNLEKLLKELSPTPALCGNPRDFAMDIISRSEKFERGCYGGFCGPFHSLTDFSFHVGVRCASVTSRSYCVYVGGGITFQSDVNSEWKETELKIPF